ncbi:MAG: hypothetical protein DRI61_04135 [Chloroflexi bacterium]|nr:MAG: hypothetical protein DRI61_04135 [Chloroflexota bacterium]
MILDRNNASIFGSEDYYYDEADCYKGVVRKRKYLAVDGSYIATGTMAGGPGGINIYNPDHIDFNLEIDIRLVKLNSFEDPCSGTMYMGPMWINIDGNNLYGYIYCCDYEECFRYVEYDLITGRTRILDECLDDCPGKEPYVMYSGSIDAPWADAQTGEFKLFVSDVPGCSCHLVDGGAGFPWWTYKNAMIQIGNVYFLGKDDPNKTEHEFYKRPLGSTSYEKLTNARIEPAAHAAWCLTTNGNMMVIDVQNKLYFFDMFGDGRIIKTPYVPYSVLGQMDQYVLVVSSDGVVMLIDRIKRVYAGRLANRHRELVGKDIFFQNCDNPMSRPHFVDKHEVWRLEWK